MQAINVRSIIVKSGLGIEETAAKLFPDHKDSYRALRRIMNGEGSLSAEEIVRLSQITGFEVSLLFNPDIWDAEATADGYSQTIKLRSAEYVAELDMTTLKTTVIKIGSSDIRTFWVSAETPFREYLCKLTEFVSN